MKKKKIVLEDGRYLIYFTFSKADTAEPKPKVKSTAAGGKA